PLREPHRAQPAPPRDHPAARRLPGLRLRRRRRCQLRERSGGVTMATGGEAERLEALRKYDILDSEPEMAYDDLALLAAHICETPMAAITLVDEARQWFKARVGYTVRETPRAISFCTHAIQQPGIFIVPDAAEDAVLR